MAGAFGCDPSYCRAVAGTEVAIRQMPSILRAKRGSPKHADHAQSWRSDGASVVTSLDPLELVEKADVVVLVNPNNPDGHCWPVERIEHARARLAKRGGWLIVDEAYADLDPSKSVAPFAGRRALIVLRSFGKFYGLAGLRLGAVLAPPTFCAKLGKGSAAGMFPDRHWLSANQPMQMLNGRRQPANIWRCGCTSCGH